MGLLVDNTQWEKNIRYRIVKPFRAERHLQSFLNFAKHFALSCLLNVDNIKKFTVPFLNYKLPYRVFLADHSVAMVIYYVTKMITTCSPMLGQYFDTMSVASSDKEWL